MDKVEFLEEMILPMEDENGNSIDCEVLAIFPFHEKQYIVLQPEGLDENWLYRFVPAGEEEFNLEYIEDEEELVAVGEEFDRLCEEAEIDEVMGD